MDKLLGYGIQQKDSMWLVVEVHGQHASAQQRRSEQKAYVSHADAEKEARLHATVTNTRYFGQLR